MKNRLKGSEPKMQISNIIDINGIACNTEFFAQYSLENYQKFLQKNANARLIRISLLYISF